MIHAPAANGIICVYKQKDFTSFDVVAIMRKIFKTKKIGHGGTLDPMAEGVLPIFLGNATRAVDFQPDDGKEYLAGFRFGLTTDTQDITGRVLTTDSTYVSRNKMIFVERYKGEMEQIPPMYSAVKVDGEKLCNLARRGIEVERKPKKITVHSIKVEHYEDNEGVMRVSCSKGTYIRTLIHDIGQDIGTGAVMTSLIRTRAGKFTIDDCYYLDDLRKIAVEEPEKLRKLLMGLERFYADYPMARLDSNQTRLFLNGVKLAADRVRLDRIFDGVYAVLSDERIILGLAKIAQDHSLEIIQRFRFSGILEESMEDRFNYDYDE